MKFVTFKADGQTRIGAFDGATVTELSSLPAGVTDLRGLLAEVAPADLAKVEAKGKTWDLADVELLPVIPNPNKIICVGVNYRSHREETGQDPNLKPTIFTRFADTQIAHGAVVTHPSATDSFDYEGELAVIIGRDAKKCCCGRCVECCCWLCPIQRSHRSRLAEALNTVDPWKELPGNWCLWPSYGDFG